jgi:hypothetical protein
MKRANGAQSGGGTRTKEERPDDLLTLTECALLAGIQASSMSYWLRKKIWPLPSEIRGLKLRLWRRDLVEATIAKMRKVRSNP